MIPGVAGSSPVGHPDTGWWTSQVAVGESPLLRRSVAQLVEHRSPKPGVAGSIPAGPVLLGLVAGVVAGVGEVARVGALLAFGTTLVVIVNREYPP